MIKKNLLTLLFFAVVFIAGCATGITGRLRLQDRELLIHPDKPGLGYPSYVETCKDRKKPFKWIGKKCKTVWTDEFYDFNKKADREKLRNAGFSCKSKMRFIY